MNQNLMKEEIKGRLNSHNDCIEDIGGKDQDVGSWTIL
jgi:hypothetical protein